MSWTLLPWSIHLSQCGYTSCFCSQLWIFYGNLLLGSAVVSAFLSRKYHLCIYVDLVCVKLSAITSIPSVKIFCNYLITDSILYIICRYINNLFI